MSDTLSKLVSTVLDVPLSEVDDSLSRGVSAQWDSLNHLLLIAEIESVFKMKFNMRDIESIKTYKQLREKVRESTNGNV